MGPVRRRCPPPSSVKNRCAFLECGGDDFHLVRLADQLRLDPAFFDENCIRCVGLCKPNERLGGTQGGRRFQGQTFGQIHRRREGIARNFGDQSPRLRLRRINRCRRVSEFAQHITAHQPGQQHHAPHIWHDAPFHLHHSQPGVWGRNANVGAQRQLQACTIADAVHRSDDGHGHAGPDHGNLLPLVRRPFPMAARHKKLAWVFANHGPKATHIDTGAKPFTLARNHTDPCV
mmetsp:Transcript_23754/g.42613  ORF Transcript_23754/g.42613 Transcript_23754/m.42613 type:complete len:232 (+) Transcript_23754:102-797(+)